MRSEHADSWVRFEVPLTSVTKVCAIELRKQKKTNTVRSKTYDTFKIHSSEWEKSH
jgi:hypothetical protein